MIKISLIVIVYNLQDYIKACLDSIMPQLNQSVELIIVNDGSTDNSQSLIEDLVIGKDYVKFLSKENGGIGSARNFGLAHATGEYVWFIDGDDEIVPLAIQDLLPIVDRGIDLISFYPYHLRFGETAWRMESDLKGLEISGIPKFLKNIEKIPNAVWLFLMRRDFLLSNDLVFDDKMIFEDDHFILSLYNEALYIYTVGKALYVYKERPGSVRLGGFDERKMASMFKLVDKCSKMTAKNLTVMDINSKLFWFIDSLIKDIYAVHDEKLKSIYITELYRIVPFQKIYLREPFGVMLKKIKYNFRIT